MKTKTITLYEFDELPEKVRAKVLERERYINVDDSWWSRFALEEWEDKLKAMGFENPNIAYSGFCSQGDGASFTCKKVDIKAFITSQKAKGRFKNILKALESDKIEANASVNRSDHHYCHEYTVDAETDILYCRDAEPKNYAAIEKEEGELRNLITETVRKLSKQIYRELESEYNHLTSDEAVIDTIKANEYTFTESGRMEN